MRVLFISHSASRTGAPILLHAMVEELAAEHHVRPRFLLTDDGPLRTDFSRLGPVTVRRIPRLTKGRQVLVRHGWAPAARLVDAGAAADLRRLCRDIDVIYSNTLVNGATLELLRPGPPIVCHAHELRTFLNTHVDERTVMASIEAPHFVAASHAVATMLVNNFSVAPHRVMVAEPGVLPRFSRALVTTSEENRRNWRRTNGISDEAYVIGGVGTVDLRKGADIFVQLGRSLGGHRSREVVLVWLGGPAEAHLDAFLRHDARSLGDAATIRFLGSVDDPLSAYDGMDVLALTSREDPYPLAMLEAAARGRPVVAFSGSGGADEFIADSGGGELVPYLDVDAMRSAIFQYMREPSRAALHGERGRSFVLEQRTVGRLARRVAGLLKDVRVAA
jgi:glycosyltransferase involved in cell wall biosynthesis